MPLLKPLKLGDHEFMYKEDDYADEVYFITKGRINLVIEVGCTPFKSFFKGSYIGEVEIIVECTRLDTIIVSG